MKTDIEQISSKYEGFPEIDFEQLTKQQQQEYLKIITQLKQLSTNI